MGLVLDSGGMIAFERGDRMVAALVEAARRRRERIVTSSGCVAQVWRSGGSRQALLARLLRGLDEQALDHHVSRTIGELCASSASRDVVDAHIANLARNHDIVVTSDADELQILLAAARSSARIQRC